jgi:outer membrane receptor protein involved in Fe transport
MNNACPTGRLPLALAALALLSTAAAPSRAADAAIPAATAASAATATATAPTAPAAAATTQPQDASQVVVVTGTAGNVGRRKVETSFSITTATEEQIKEAAPSSTADLLKIVPGVFVETSGGTAGANIEVRGFPTGGDAPYVTIQLDGVPLYPAATLSFLENSSLFRIDDTIDHVEVLRGGPSPIWANGQPGATANFITKRGEDVPEGLIRLSTGTGSEKRVDGYWGGKVADRWYLSGGGFWRTTNGVRDTQYPSDEGYQGSLSLHRKLDDGDLAFWVRAAHDKNTFYTGIPLQANADGSHVSGYPGINASYGALQGNGIRNTVIETTLAPVGGTPGTMAIDLADGRGLRTNMEGVDYHQKFGAWTISDKAGLMAGDAPTKALFTGSTPLSITDYIAGKVAFANGPDSHTGLTNATTGTATYLDGTPVAATQQVISAGIWSVDKHLSASTNDLRASVELGGGHTLSLGSYLADYKSHDLWYLGNSLLMTAESHARPVNVTLDNGVQVTRAGFDGGSFYTLDASYHGTNYAFTAADEWQVSKQLRADAGVRWEHEKVTGQVGQPASGDLDRNPLTLYDNNASYLTGNYQAIDFSTSRVSTTAGGSYMLTDRTNAYVRVNSGVRLPAFDDLRGGQTQVEKIMQYEAGLKTSEKTYDLFLTAFYNTFKGQPFQQFVTDGNGGGQNVTYILSSHAEGLEFEGAVRPLDGFELAFGGDWTHATFVDSGTLSGKQVERQPRFQSRVTPSWRMATDHGDMKLFATWAHIGKRFGDVDNQQPLPAYDTLDAGVIVNYNDWEARLTGTNLTNTIGLTEGNARVVGSGQGTNGVFIGRPIFGRAFELSVAYHF